VCVGGLASRDSIHDHHHQGGRPAGRFALLRAWPRARTTKGEMARNDLFLPSFGALLLMASFP
jgi:hypothetical protein